MASIGSIYAEQERRREAARRLELKQTARESFRLSHLRLASDFRERRFRADRFDVPTPSPARLALDRLVLALGLIAIGLVLAAYGLDLASFLVGH